MPIPVTIPRLGWTMEEGTFVEWLMDDGANVRSGDTLFRIEGEKATEEIECFDNGILHILTSGPKPGDRVVVGSVIGYLLRPGEAAIERLPEPTGERPGFARRASVPAGRDSAARNDARATPAITPRARRLAERHGIDWLLLRGTGKSGRIRERDVLAISSTRAIPLTPMRRAIATRMVESLQSTAPVTLTSVVDATNLVALRERYKAVGKPAPSYTDLFVKLTAVALLEHPILTSRWMDAVLDVPERNDIGIAADSDAGLLGPVIRHVPALALAEVAARSRELIERACGGTLTASEMRGGCFTVTNLGAYGVDAFTPIINPPECSVLGVGRIARQPVMDGDRVVGRDLVTLSLTFDHRVVDGGPAARFLQTLARCIENPGRWISG